MKALPPIDFITLAEPGKDLPRDLGIVTFESRINAWWRRQQDSFVALVRLRNPSDQDWAYLGECLLQLISGDAVYVSTSIEGEWQCSDGTAWLQTRCQSPESGIVDLNLSVSRLPENHPLGDAITRHLELHSIDTGISATLTSSILQRRGSQLFIGASLLFCTFGEDISAELRREGISSRQIVESLTGLAISWIVPVDENIGFYVGLRASSSAYRVLSGA